MHSSTDQTATEQPEILARGPWELDRIQARWREEEFEPSPAQSQAADRAILGLRERGSPSHDGFALEMAPAFVAIVLLALFGIALVAIVTYVENRFCNW